MSLALPAFATLIAEPLYVLADTAIVGHLGTDQLAGLAIASNVLLTGFAVFIFLAYGTTAAVSRLLGAGEEREAARQAIQGMWLAFAMGIGAATIVFVLADPLLSLMGARGAVAGFARTYLRVSLLGFPALIVGLAGVGYLRGIKDTRTPLIVAVVSAILNVVIELTLIEGFGYGIGASALSTVIAQTVATTVFVSRVRSSVKALGVSLVPDLAVMRRLLGVGRDLFIRTAALRGSLTLSAMVAARIGVEDIAAHQVAFEVWSFLALALDALAIAAQAMIGTLLGAGRSTEARAVGRRVIEWGVIGGSAMGLAVFLSRNQLPHVFSDDPAVIGLTGFVLVFVAVAQPLNGVVFALDGILIGAGDMTYIAKAMAASAAVYLPMLVAVLVLDLGIGWLWVALTSFMVARAVGLIVRFRGDRWLITGRQRSA